MSLFEQIESFDVWLLLKVNGLNSPFLDEMMWSVSSPYFGVPFYLFCILDLSSCRIKTNGFFMWSNIISREFQTLLLNIVLKKFLKGFVLLIISSLKNNYI